MPMSKVAQLSLIHTDIYHCTQCALHEKRTRTVPGAGNPQADLMFIGEAPGFHEDQQGLPFVGVSGQYLDELLKGIGLEREQVFIANVVKCRPPDNRDPLVDEIERCNPYLRQQIEVIQPLVIATLGRFSMGLFFPNERISAIHGQVKYGTNRAYFPLYHPAAVLRDNSGGLRALMEADFRRLKQVLEDVRKQQAMGGVSEPSGQAEQAKAALQAEDVHAEVLEQVTEDLPEPPKKPKQKGLFD